MAKSIFITGTDTDIGKTTVSEEIISRLRQEKKEVIYYKPIQSGGSGDTDKISKLGIETVNSYTFKAPYSPHLASELESVKIEADKIITRYRELKEQGAYLLVEGAGGLLVPLVRGKYYISDLIVEMNIGVVLVTELKVGGINHTLLSYEHLKSVGLNRIAILANRYGDSEHERDNKKVIEDYTGVEVVTDLRGGDIIEKLFG